ncbi:MAG: hypothetical protein Q9160_004019 [Pyrenula sp. 1 TL-2023]
MSARASALGLCITFVLGAIVILLELTIEPLFRYIQQHYRANLYKSLEWVTNETLQLQRLAHEELGAGTWVGTDEDLPTTEKDEPLAILDVSDDKHPRLVYRPESQSKEKPEDSEVGKCPSPSHTARVTTQESGSLDGLHPTSQFNDPPLTMSDTPSSSQSQQLWNSNLYKKLSVPREPGNLASVEMDTHV